MRERKLPMPVSMARLKRSDLPELKRETLVSEGTIDAMDLHYFYPTDDPAAAAEYVRDIAIRKFGLRYAKTPGAPKLRKRRWWLFE